MEKIRSSNLLWIFVAVFIVGFYTVDLPTEKASVLSSSGSPFDVDEKAEKSEPPSSKTIAELNNAIVHIADNAKRTVVTVKVTQKIEAQLDPFSRFFGPPLQQPREFERRGHGSGVIVSKDGYILTNNHVVEDANKIEVTLYNDESYDAEIVGTDPLTDIAVLKIDDDNADLDVIKLGNSKKLRVGEMVLAIGSPLEANLAHSVSLGIVSAKGRSIGILQQSGGYENFIQTDAAINPGNSGGPLINMDGELVGVNSAIATRSGGSDGIGFAVPVDIAKRVMKSIIENGRVVRGYLGITNGGEVDGTMARALDLDKPYGVIVGSVEEGGPADKAGLKKDDIIHTINGEPIKSWNSFRTKIATSSPGTEVELGISRKGSEKTVTVTLGELDPELAQNPQQKDRTENLQKRLGFSVDELTPRIIEELDLSQNQEGVVVTQISRSSEAYEQGLRRGHVITEVDRQPVKNVREFNNAIMNLVDEGKNIVLLRVVNPGGPSQLIAFEL